MLKLVPLFGQLGLPAVGIGLGPLDRPGVERLLFSVAGQSGAGIGIRSAATCAEPGSSGMGAVASSAACG
ncbi:MAG TPA: hypothetical protein VGW38_09815 [Chloroflexota bacterium]|nr:hypothetical protein [Chloroflexota bacterium]